MPISPRSIYGLVLRYAYLYTRNPVRVFELFFWPFVQLLVWGFLTTYLTQTGDGGTLHPISFLIGGFLLWDVLFRATQGVSISFLEDVWTRNLLNIWVAPLSRFDMIGGLFAVGFLRVCIIFPILILAAWLMYSFNMMEVNWMLAPFFASLLLFGWSIGILANSLIIRWGQSAEGLAWAVPFMVQPFSAVFYPVSVLPGWLQPFCLAMPSTHVFEGMRAVLGNDHSLTMNRLATAFSLNVIWFLVAAFILNRVLAKAREKGLLVKVATQ